jgi:hypothetical protein
MVLANVQLCDERTHEEFRDRIRDFVSKIPRRFDRARLRPSASLRDIRTEAAKRRELLYSLACWRYWQRNQL